MIDIGIQLTVFLEKAVSKECLKQSHLSLYSAILMMYYKSPGENPFRVTRKELMKYSAIHSIATYHKCIQDMVKEGLIGYQPSYHPRLASVIWLVCDK